VRDVRDGALRMAGNYAAVVVAWRYLCEFAGMDHAEGDFIHALLAEMNGHIAETSADREPWVWILETVLCIPAAAPAYGRCEVSQMVGSYRPNNPNRCARPSANGKAEGLLRVESARTPVANLHVKAGSAILWRFRMPRQTNGESHETE
jgi:hypothetical protein